MKKVITKSDVVASSDVSVHTPIFAKKDGKFVGMLVKDNEGWIVRLGGETGAYGYCSSREKCMERGATQYDYEFYIEDGITE